MKKLILISVLICFGFLLQAQTISFSTSVASISTDTMFKFKLNDDRAWTAQFNNDTATSSGTGGEFNVYTSIDGVNYSKLVTTGITIDSTVTTGIIMNNYNGAKYLGLYIKKGSLTGGTIVLYFNYNHTIFTNATQKLVNLPDFLIKIDQLGNEPWVFGVVLRTTESTWTHSAEIKEAIKEENVPELINLLS